MQESSLQYIIQIFPSHNASNGHHCKGKTIRSQKQIFMRLLLCYYETPRSNPLATTPALGARHGRQRDDPNAQDFCSAWLRQTAPHTGASPSHARRVAYGSGAVERHPTFSAVFCHFGRTSAGCHRRLCSGGCDIGKMAGTKNQAVAESVSTHFSAKTQRGGKVTARSRH